MRFPAIHACGLAPVLIRFVLSCTVPCDAQGLPEWVSDQPFSRLPDMPADEVAGPDVSLFTGNWRESLPVPETGAYAEQPVLTRATGDPLAPEQTGAVLTCLSRLSHVTLGPGMATQNLRFDAEQIVLYILGGNGSLISSVETFTLRPGIYAFVPAGVSFTVSVAAGEPLTMYLAAEPVPDGFQPADRIVCRDVVSSGPELRPRRWHNRIIRLLSARDGLAMLNEVCIVVLPPRAMSQPFSVRQGVEMVYATISGDPHTLLGKQLRPMPPGSGYKVVPDGVTPHANINQAGTPSVFLYLGGKKAETE